MPEQQYEEQQYISQGNQQGYDPALYAQQMENSSVGTKELYLNYEKLIFEKAQMWRGMMMNDDGTWERVGDRVMPEEAIRLLTSQISNFLSIPTRLGNLTEKQVLNRSWSFCNFIRGWLKTVGFAKYRIAESNIYPVWWDVFHITNMSLTWSLEQGGRKLMTTTLKSGEMVTHVVNAAQGKAVEVQRMPKQMW